MKSKLQNYTPILLIIMITCTLFLSACSFANPIPTDGVSKYGTYFDTYCTITIFGLSEKDANPILTKCFQIFDKYEEMFSVRKSGSDIYNINQSAGNKVTVSSETIDLLEKSIAYSNETNGLFDITVYTILNEYDFHEGSYHIPSDDMITKSLSHIGYNNISIDSVNNCVTMSDAQTQIDIGGIAKGYIADQIASYLESEKITGAIINIGGDMRIIGSKSPNKPFQIGISDPFNPGSTIYGVKLTNKSIATSGTYIRSFTLDDKLYHHILDPKTGLPADTDIDSATVISSSATDCDTLCTILILLGSRDALQFIENIPDTEALLILNDGSTLMTTSMSHYLIQ